MFPTRNAAFTTIILAASVAVAGAQALDQDHAMRGGNMGDR